MNETTVLFKKLVRQLMNRPAVAFQEGIMREEVESICEEHGLRFRRDRYGNVIVRLPAKVRGRQPIALAAHMDHPGFEIRKQVGPGVWEGKFLGGVPTEYFKKGVKVRLWPGNAPAKLEACVGKPKDQVWLIRLAKGAQLKGAPTMAVWDLPGCVMKGGKVLGRACDDLIGVAAILVSMIQLKRVRNRGEVIGVISRAEEVGFVGALAVANSKTLPPRALVISLETSSEIPGVQMGEGVIVRVGDRSTVFNSDATRFLSEVGESLSADGTFKYQRALMGGGSCEGTAFQAYGFRTAAVCVALGNYHNRGPRLRIREEYIALADAVSMVRLLTSAVKRGGEYEALVGKLGVRLERLRKGVDRLLG